MLAISVATDMSRCLSALFDILSIPEAIAVEVILVNLRRR